MKLLGKRVGLRFFQNRLMKMWQPVGTMDVIDLENDYFLGLGTGVMLNEPLWKGHGEYQTTISWCSDGGLSSFLLRMSIGRLRYV